MQITSQFRFSQSRVTDSSRPSRRSFVAGSASVVVATAYAGRADVAPERSATAAPAPNRRFRAAVIGHTGRGDYGHELEQLFKGRDDCEVVAIADPDDNGRAAAAARSGAARQYADYREMLAKEKPDLVSVAPRHTDQHVAMALAAFSAGAHVFMEKPIAASPAEADEMIAAADRAGRKFCVAHQMRVTPGVVRLKQVLADRLIGDLLQIDTWGKQDARSGGEDMLVLGTHLFDLMRHFAGDLQWCTARVLHKGRDITTADARQPSEPIGLVAGDEIFAQFVFPKGVNATFTSRAAQRAVTAAWGMKLTGSKGVLRLMTGVEPHTFVLEPGTWERTGRIDRWEPLDGKPVGEAKFAITNRRVVDDWIAAIREDREPTCSARNAAKAVEMVAAVYWAGLTGARVPLPLSDRKHPLAQ